MNFNKKSSRFDSLSSDQDNNSFLQQKRRIGDNRNFDRRNRLVYNKESTNQISNNDLIKEEDFPEVIFNTNETVQENKTINYLNKCKQYKEEENKYKIKPGWVCLKKDKNLQIQYSVDGKTWVKDMEDFKTEEEKKVEEENKEIEFYNEIDWRLEKIEIDDEERSFQYYLDTGRLDIHAQVIKEREEYEKYCKQFEDEQQEDFESEEEYYSD